MVKCYSALAFIVNAAWPPHRVFAGRAARVVYAACSGAAAGPEKCCKQLREPWRYFGWLEPFLWPNAEKAVDRNGPPSSRTREYLPK
jgi:hypothetical protein